jgi:hypothetical protein
MNQTVTKFHAANFEISTQDHLRAPLLLAGIGVTGLLLAGCTTSGTENSSLPTSSASSPQPTPTTSLLPPSTSTLETSPQGAPSETTAGPTSIPSSAVSEFCKLDIGSIYAGGKFNQENSQHISDQLSALAVAKNTSPVTVEDVQHAISLMTNATIDNTYAAGLNIANQSPLPLPSVQDLLTAVASLPPDACPGQTQRREISALYRTIIDGYGPKVAAQSTTELKLYYAVFQRSYQSFKQAHPDLFSGK